MRAAVVLFAIAAAAHAQFKATSTLVLAPTTVTTADGKFVDGLQSRDLTLFDNNVPQPIQVEEAFNPLSLIVTLQTSASAWPVIDKLGNLGVLFTHVLAGDHGETAIVTFAEQSRIRQEFTTNPDHLASALRDLHVQGTGVATFDAIQEALRLFTRRPTINRRVLLVIAEKHDHSSKLKLAAILQACERQNVLVYWLTYSPFLTAFTQRQKTVKSPDRKKNGEPVPVDPAPGSILSVVPAVAHDFKSDAAEELTHATGGRTLSFLRKDALEEAVQAIGAEVHRQYIVSFQPPKSEPGLFHAIRIEVKNRPEVLVRTRTGYWAAQ